MARSDAALSRIDRKVLRELQRDGRITYSELAHRVGLSVSACSERVRRLERDKVIRGYTALVDAETVGRGLVVLVQVALVKNSQLAFHDFNRAVKLLPEVQECYLTSGNFDYLIKARVRDMHQYRTFLGETLLSLPGVLETVSHPVMEQVKETLFLPVAD